MHNISSILGGGHAADRIAARSDDDYFIRKRACFFGGGGDSGADEAAEAQVEATEKQIEFYKEIYDKQQQANAPQRAIGNQALAALGGAYGFNAGYDPYPISGFGAGGTSGGGSMNALAGGGSGGGTPVCTKRNRDYTCREWSYKGGSPSGGQAQQQFMGGSQANPATGQGGYVPGTPRDLFASDPIYSHLAGDTLQFLQNDPGYQFRLQQGQKALDRQGAAAGRLYSGAQLQAAQRYGQDYASNEFGTAWNRANSARTDAYNRLASLAGLQQVSTSNLNNNLSSLGQQVGAGYGAIGDARATGYLNQANARQSGFNNLLNAGIAGANIYGAARGFG